MPDATTIFRFREELVNADLIELLFARFDQFLRDNGFWAQNGRIVDVDASIVKVPIQRNSREGNGRFLTDT